MRHRRVAEGAHDVEQRVGVSIGADVEQGLGVSSAGRHVGKLHGRRYAALRMEERRELVEPVVGNARDADVGFGLAVCPGRLAGAREKLKERGFSRRGESDQAGSKHRP